MSEYYLCVVLYIGYLIANAILFRVGVFQQDKPTLPTIAWTVMTTCCFIICWEAMLLVLGMIWVVGLTVVINAKAYKEHLNTWF